MALYWILLLGQTIGDAKILSHVIPLFRRLVDSGLDEKPPSKILVSTLLGVTIIQVLLAGSALVRNASAAPHFTFWTPNSVYIPA